MKDKYLHIISFDIPYPADYGGVIDVFYKIKALHSIGVKIILHCFQYGTRTPQEELNKYCEKVFYYKRNTGFMGVSLKLPYIVYSRKNKELLQNLLKDEYPILFEGVHTTYYASHPYLSNRLKFYRAHNIEHEYYDLLAKTSTSILRKLYYKIENVLLCNYSNNYHVDEVLSISYADKKYFQQHHNNVKYIPAFHAYDTVISKTGSGKYCLFHGNLSVQENIDAVDFLVHKVFHDLDIPLIVTGKNPTKYVQDICLEHKINLIENPTNDNMNELIQNAQCIVLPTFQHSGVKLKLLNSLFSGRFVLVNSIMTAGTKLENICVNCKDALEFKKNIEMYFKNEFTQEIIEHRAVFLKKQFNNIESAKKIAELI